MGILTRFKDIMSANINALLDKCEDPEKMIDQYMRNLESDLGKVKAETASVMAEETRAKRELDECTAQINKMQSYAEKALRAGNEADARRSSSLQQHRQHLHRLIMWQQIMQLRCVRCTISSLKIYHHLRQEEQLSRQQSRQLKLRSVSTRLVQA